MMEPLSPKELIELRQMIEDDNMTEEDKDFLIHTVDHIVQSFILAARGLDSVQLSLVARANVSFQNPLQHVSLKECDKNKRVDLQTLTRCEGEVEKQYPNTERKEGPRRPEQA